MMLDMSVATSSMCLDVEEMEKVYPGTRQLADVMDAKAPEVISPPGFPMYPSADAR